MRLKLIPSISILLTIILVIAAFILYYTFNRIAEEDAELHLLNRANNLELEISSRPDLFKKDPASFVFSASKNEFTSSAILVQFLDKQGNLLAKSPNLKQNSLPFTSNENDTFKDIELSDGTELKVFQKEINLNKLDKGFIVVGAPTSQIDRNLENLRNILIVVIFCTIVILGFCLNALVAYDFIRNQRKFFSFASHELRTPLSIISGNTELALRKERQPEEYKETLDIIKNETDWMSRLVSNLLIIFRNQAGTEKINRCRFNFGELVMEAASSLKKRYPTKSITLKLPDDIEIYADADRIKQAVNNLLENAARYTVADGKINISLASEANRFILEVSDNGKGIDEKLQKKIFDAFYRLEKEENEGMGLGLAITKWIVEAHKGNIKVVSEDGKGAIFTVILPKK